MQDVSKIKELFSSEIVCVNVGPLQMADAMTAQGVETIQVDFRPVAGGDPELRKMLELLGGMEW